jgi:hypothetical protein
VENQKISPFHPIHPPFITLSNFPYPEFSNRLEKSIREVDQKHILFLDGNTSALENGKVLIESLTG